MIFSRERERVIYETMISNGVREETIKRGSEAPKRCLSSLKLGAFHSFFVTLCFNKGSLTIITFTIYTQKKKNRKKGNFQSIQ